MREILGIWLPAVTELESGKEKAIVSFRYSKTVPSLYEHDNFK